MVRFIQTVIHKIKANISSWLQLKHDEIYIENKARKLEGIELVAFVLVLLRQKLISEIDQIMAWGDRSIYFIPRLALILAVTVAVLFVLAQVVVRVFHQFQIL